MVFYVLILFGTIARIIEYGFKITDVANSFTSTNNKILFTGSCAFIIQIFVELTLILTMHKLVLALKLIVGDINRDQMKCAKAIGLMFTFLSACVFFLFEIILWEHREAEHQWIRYFYVVYIGVLIVIYTCCIVIL